MPLRNPARLRNKVYYFYRIGESSLRPRLPGSRLLQRLSFALQRQFSVCSCRQSHFILSLFMLQDSLSPFTDHRLQNFYSGQSKQVRQDLLDNAIECHVILKLSFALFTPSDFHSFQLDFYQFQVHLICTVVTKCT